MFSISTQVFNTLVCSYRKWLKGNFHHISWLGGFVILVDRLNGLGSGLVFTVRVGSGVAYRAERQVGLSEDGMTMRSL